MCPIFCLPKMLVLTTELVTNDFHAYKSNEVCLEFLIFFFANKPKNILVHFRNTVLHFSVFA